MHRFYGSQHFKATSSEYYFQLAQSDWSAAFSHPLNLNVCYPVPGRYAGFSLQLKAQIIRAALQLKAIILWCSLALSKIIKSLYFFASGFCYKVYEIYKEFTNTNYPEEYWFELAQNYWKQAFSHPLNLNINEPKTEANASFMTQAKAHTIRASLKVKAIALWNYFALSKLIKASYCRILGTYTHLKKKFIAFLPKQRPRSFAFQSDDFFNHDRAQYSTHGANNNSKNTSFFKSFYEERASSSYEEGGSSRLPDFSERLKNHFSWEMLAQKGVQEPPAGRIGYIVISWDWEQWMNKNGPAFKIAMQDFLRSCGTEQIVTEHGSTSIKEHLQKIFTLAKKDELCEIFYTLREIYERDHLGHSYSRSHSSFAF